MSNQVLAAIRQLFERAEALDPEIETTDADVAALLAGLGEIMARKREWATAQVAHRKYAGTVHRREVPPVLSPFDGAWQITNTSESTYSINIGTDGSAPIPPGASYVDFDPRDALAERIEAGALAVYPPGIHDQTWRDALSQLAHERRAQVASKVGDAAELRQALPRVRFVMRANIQVKLEELAKAPAATEQRAPARRFHTIPEAKPVRAERPEEAQPQNLQSAAK